MLFKILCILAAASLAMAAPQGCRVPDLEAQLRRVEDLRRKGLNCQPGPQETFVCDDSMGGNCEVNIYGGGSCLI